MHIHVLDLLAQIRLLLDQPNKAVFNLQEDLGTLLDLLRECTSRFDGEFLAAGFRTAILVTSLYQAYWVHRQHGSHLRDRWIGRQVHLLDGQDIVYGVMTEDKRVVSRHREITPMTEWSLVLEEFDVRIS